MKKILLLGLVTGALSGCSTYRGGTTDDSYGAAYPEPMAPSTFRPGMNADDIRDPTSVTRPGAYQTYPANPQWGLPGPSR